MFINDAHTVWLLPHSGEQFVHSQFSRNQLSLDASIIRHDYQNENFAALRPMIEPLENINGFLFRIKKFTYT